MKVYLVQHCYEKEVVEEINVDEVKIIGIFSSYQKAEEIKEKYKKIQGFNRFPDDCFYIDEYEIDDEMWKEGFITWDGEEQKWIE